MSFYLERLEAARRHQRVVPPPGAGCARAPPPRTWPGYYPHYQHAAAILPRPPPLRAGEGGAWNGGGGMAAAWTEVATPRSGSGWGGYAAARGGCGFSSAMGAPAAAPAREEEEEAGGRGRGEACDKRRLLVAPAIPDARCPPPKRRALSARRRFPPGCGRDAAPALPLPGSDGDSRSGPARRDGCSGAPRQESAPALAGGENSVLSEAAEPPGDAAAAGDSGALNNSSDADAAAGATLDGAPHCPGAALVKPSEDSGKNSVSESLVPAVRLLPKPSTVSAYRRFPPGCGRRGAPLLAGGGCSNQVSSPPLSEAVPADRVDDMEIVAPLCSVAADADGLEEGEIASDPPGINGMEAHASHSSSQEMVGNTLQCKEQEQSKSGGSSGNVAADGSLSQGHLPKGAEQIESEKVSEYAMTDTAGVPEDEGAMMRRKRVLFTPRKSVKPPKSIQKPSLSTQYCSQFFKEAAETELERHTTTGIENTDEFTKDRAMQDPIPMSADKFPCTKGNETATVSHYFGPKKKHNTKNDTNEFSKDRAVQDPMSAGKFPWTNKAKEAATVGHYFGPKKNKNKKKNKTKKEVNDKEDSILENNEFFKALAVREGNFEQGPQDADDRSKIKMICSKFESICRSIVQGVEQGYLKVRRIDLAADKLIRKLPGFTKPGPIVGDVPGVEVGDEFLYRVQLALVGLHRPYQGGIDTTRDGHGALIAISVVASGGYPDELSCPGELIYTGSGKKGDGDQKLEHGNLALRNCVEKRTPVRVIHGFRGQNREEGSHLRAKEVSRFTYDGLYHVVNWWKEGRPGSKVLKYKLQRIPGQPGVPLNVAKFVRKNSV